MRRFGRQKTRLRSESASLCIAVHRKGEGWGPVAHNEGTSGTEAEGVAALRSPATSGQPKGGPDGRGSEQEEDGGEGGSGAGPAPQVSPECGRHAAIDRH